MPCITIHVLGEGVTQLAGLLFDPFLSTTWWML